jgi:hypothetical protein
LYVKCGIVGLPVLSVASPAKHEGICRLRKKVVHIEDTSTDILDLRHWSPNKLKVALTKRKKKPNQAG